MHLSTSLQPIIVSPPSSPPWPPSPNGVFVDRKASGLTASPRSTQRTKRKASLASHRAHCSYANGSTAGGSLGWMVRGSMVVRPSPSHPPLLRHVLMMVVDARVRFKTQRSPSPPPPSINPSSRPSSRLRSGTTSSWSKADDEYLFEPYAGVGFVHRSWCLRLSTPA